MEFRYDMDPDIIIKDFEELKEYNGKEGLIKLKKYPFEVKGTIDVVSSHSVAFRYKKNQRTQGMLFTISRSTFRLSDSSLFEYVKVPKGR